MFFQGQFKKIEPASAAIIMAGGIFLFGAIEAFPRLDIIFGKVFVVILLIIWLRIYQLLSWQFIHKQFFFPYINHPVQSFTIGTWIAGVSVLCNVLLKYFPIIIGLIKGIAIINVVLSLFFFFICVNNFKKLYTQWDSYEVDGVLLLSTVGVQSIIILLNNVFYLLPTLYSEIMIISGLLFYILSIILIGKRYLTTTWTLAHHWANTNCIIHGALSITGLATISAQAFSASFVIALWWITFTLLFIIEIIELVRAKQRITKYGFKKGLLTYHVSQWSRNFTFGMFFTFTLYMHKQPIYESNKSLYVFQQHFLAIWAWVVLIALIIQVYIFINTKRTEKS